MKLEQWFEQKNINAPALTNLDVISILFGKNKNSLEITSFGHTIAGIGLSENEALQLSWMSGMLNGFLVAIDKNEDLQYMMDKIINPMMVSSKKFGYNIGRAPVVVKGGESKDELGILKIGRDD